MAELEAHRSVRRLTDQVIRENPSAARGFAGAPKNRQRILSVHRGGCSWNAGPQQWYEGSEALQTAAQWAPPPGQSSPPPIRLSKIRRRKAPGGRGLGNLVRPVSPPGTRFPGAVSRPGSKRRRGHRLPFGSALVSVLPRTDRAVRTVPPAVCTHVRSAIVCACHVKLCTSMFVKALLFRPG